MAIVKKGMGKPMKKAKFGTETPPKKKKTIPKYDDDANDRLMADTYADYMNDKKRGKIPLEPTIQRGIKNGTLNPDGTIKNGTKRGSESNTSRTPMKNGGKMKKAKNGFDLNKDGKTTRKDVLIGRGVLPKTAKSGGSVKKCKYGCK